MNIKRSAIGCDTTEAIKRRCCFTIGIYYIKICSLFKLNFNRNFDIFVL